MNSSSTFSTIYLFSPNNKCQEIIRMVNYLSIDKLRCIQITFNSSLIQFVAKNTLFSPIESVILVILFLAVNKLFKYSSAIIFNLFNYSSPDILFCFDFLIVAMIIKRLQKSKILSIPGWYEKLPSPKKFSLL